MTSKIWLVGAVTAAALAACGGGGGGGNGSFPFINNPPPDAAQNATLSGTAATGTALAGATITVMDKTGATVCTTTTDDKGTYSCTLPAGVTAPLVISAQRDDLVLYSTTATRGDTVANVTPLTNIVASLLSPDGNPASLVGAIQADSGKVSEAALKAKVSELTVALKPLLAALGDKLDPISGVFNADGTGHDRVLDAINVSVRPDGTSANINVTVKTIPTADDAASVSINFQSDASTITALPAVTAAQLAPAGTSSLVSAFMDRMTSCFALPLTQRVDSAANDTEAAIGAASDVIAPTCRGLFVGNDPAGYHNDGQHVGRTADDIGGFSSLFRPDSTGTKFDRASLEYYRANGDMVVSYRSTDRAGSINYDTVTLRKASGALQSPGNGYDFAVAINPWVQGRDMLNAPQNSYLSTAYSVNIPKDTSVSRVLVTTPFNQTLEFFPNPGTAYMTIKQNGSLTSTPNIRLSAAWVDTTKSGNPADTETGLVFTSPQLTETQLSSLPDQNVWKLEFFGSNNQSLGVQTHRTISRAPNLGELRMMKTADFTTALRDELKSESSATGFVELGSAPNNVVDLSANGNQDGWTVPNGAVAPVNVSAYGFNFSDSIDVSGLARKTVIPCSSDGPSDLHCDANVPGAYLPGIRLTTFELVSRSSRLLTINKSLALSLAQ